MPVRRWSPLLLAVALAASNCGRATEESAGDPAGTQSTVTAGTPRSTTAGTAATTTPTSTSSEAPETAAAPVPPTLAATSPPASTEATTETTPPGTLDRATVDPVVIRLHLDRRVDDPATEGFAAFVRTVLTDERGWMRAGYQFVFDDEAHDYEVVLAEGDEVDALCLPYDTYGQYSCQIGPVVALNADRWRTAVDHWPVTLDDYRTMLVNHEVGHLLGQHHPASRCPDAGQPAPVMAQQSSRVEPCTANPWPLEWEIDCALRRLEPLAPPFERGITLTCGPDGPVPDSG